MTHAAPRERLAGAMAFLDREAKEHLADLTGVSRLCIARARVGRPVTTDSYLRLCIGLGFDPYPDIPKVPVHWIIGTFDTRTFGVGIRQTRYLNKHNIREGAKAAGISLTTFSRMECGFAVSIENVVKGCRYVGTHPFGYIIHGKHHLNPLKSNDYAERAA